MCHRYDQFKQKKVKYGGFPFKCLGVKQFLPITLAFRPIPLLTQLAQLIARFLHQSCARRNLSSTQLLVSIPKVQKRD